MKEDNKTVKLVKVIETIAWFILGAMMIMSGYTIIGYFIAISILALSKLYYNYPMTELIYSMVGDRTLANRIAIAWRSTSSILALGIVAYLY